MVSTSEPFASVRSRGEGPASATYSRSGKARTLLRTALGLLLAYHVLILVGAFFLIVGADSRNGLWEWVGVVLVVGGITTVIAVLWWTATLAHRGSPTVAGIPGELEATVPPRLRSVCSGCGWIGIAQTATCPRCRRPLIRFS